MKALTMHEPWATLLVSGQKRIETRDWRTFYRGPLAIHAGKTLPPGDDWPDPEIVGPYAFSFRGGCIIGFVRLLDCIRTEDCDPDDREREMGNFAPGRWGWIVDSILTLADPIPARGMPGIWTWDAPDAYGAIR